MGRRETRDATVKFIYSDTFTEDKSESLQERVELFLNSYDGCSPNKLDKKYVLDIATGIGEHIGEIDRLIETHTVNWTPERMAKLDIAILRVAIYELLYREDIPENVTINEAVELAKTYSHEDAGTVVNGILGSIQRSK